MESWKLRNRKPVQALREEGEMRENPYGKQEARNTIEIDGNEMI